jgi:hypothetical protein
MFLENPRNPVHLQLSLNLSWRNFLCQITRKLFMPAGMTSLEEMDEISW